MRVVSKRIKFRLLMFGSDITEKRKMGLALTAAAVFTVLAILYFIPLDIPYKICFPLFTLAGFSLWLLPWPMSFAMFASALGDLAGASGNFMVQMECFAAAHLFMIIFFVRRFIWRSRNASAQGRARKSRRLAYVTMIALLIVMLVVFAMLEIAPAAPSGAVRSGVVFYALVISMMLFMALMQRSRMYAAGACLFVFSDLVLAWNKFVEPLEYERYLIMLPYYLGQLLLFLRASRLRIVYDSVRSRGHRFTGKIMED